MSDKNELKLPLKFAKIAARKILSLIHFNESEPNDKENAEWLDTLFQEGQNGDLVARIIAECTYNYLYQPMSGTKHTQLPWTAIQYPKGNWGVRNPIFAVCIIVEQDMEDQDNGEERANATLIATACNSHAALSSRILEIQADVERLKEALGHQLSILNDLNLKDYEKIHFLKANMDQVLIFIPAEEPRDDKEEPK